MVRLGVAVGVAVAVAVAVAVRVHRHWAQFMPHRRGGVRVPQGLPMRQRGQLGRREEIPFGLTTLAECKAVCDAKEECEGFNVDADGCWGYYLGEDEWGNTMWDEQAGTDEPLSDACFRKETSTNPPPTTVVIELLEEEPIPCADEDADCSYWAPPSPPWQPSPTIWSDHAAFLLEDGFPYCRVSSNDEDLETTAPGISSDISYYVEAGYEYFNPICPWLAHMGFCVGIDTPEDGDYVDLFGDHLLGAHLLNDDFLLGDPSQDLQLTNPESDCYEACKAIQP